MGERGSKATQVRFSGRDNHFSNGRPMSCLGELGVAANS